ncbi:ubiquitin carboxyl-terminal hydrolase CYLD [Pelomyxa schiedti]|nr:ubiquitin carboxyl-terminal hydrolase CYLD [Pelomyxa schiedti]
MKPGEETSSTGEVPMGVEDEGRATHDLGVPSRSDAAAPPPESTTSTTTTSTSSSSTTTTTASSSSGPSCSSPTPAAVAEAPIPRAKDSAPSWCTWKLVVTKPRMLHFGDTPVPRGSILVGHHHHQQQQQHGDSSSGSNGRGKEGGNGLFVAVALRRAWVLTADDVEPYDPRLELTNARATLCEVNPGVQRGIQGENNSCYLDSTLFSMFAFTKIFDWILDDDSPAHEVLRTIVYNLRTKDYVPRAYTILFRRLISPLFGDCDFLSTCSEQDPEELLSFLIPTFGGTELQEFTSPSGITTLNVIQLLPQPDQGNHTIEDSLQHTLDEEKMTFSKQPPAIILKLPRYSNKHHSTGRFEQRIRIRTQTGTSHSYRLIAIQCIGLSHWVTYTVVWYSHDHAKYFFFDSMSDRPNDYEGCIPKVERIDLTPLWTQIGSDPHVTRVSQDATLLYYEPEPAPPQPEHNPTTVALSGTDGKGNE